MNLNEAFDICCEKAKLHLTKMDSVLFEPKESRTGDYYENYSNIDFVMYRWVWLTSMITGMAPIIFQTKSDKDALKWAYKFADDYKNKVFQPYTATMHDLGFIYLPYSVHLYMLTGDASHRDTALKAADELAKRFNVNGKFINTLVRDDCSVAHACFFNSKTGEKKGEANSCGYSNGSHWARGTGWFVYGMAIAYSYTKGEKFLKIAVKVGEKYLECLGENPLPVWDFRLPKEYPAKMCANTNKEKPLWDESKEENTVYNVDTSAAAIMASAFLLIDSLKPNERFKKYAVSALEKLSNEYLDTDLTKTGMLKRSNRRDVYTTYGCYYFMNALAMYLYNIRGCWGMED